MIRARIRRRKGAFTLDLELEAPPGVTAVCGPSGSGKTTLLNVLLGLEPLDAGEVRWNGQVLEQRPGGIRTPPEGRRFGAVFQEGLLFPHLTVEGNVRFALPRRPSPEQEGRAADWMRRLGLEPLRRRRPATLSGGERQRVAIARAMAAAPRALFLDEPLNGLDARLKLETLLALRRVRRDLEGPVLYVTHQPAEVLAVADRVIRLAGGKVAWQGEPARILSEARGPGSDEPSNFLEATVERRLGAGQVEMAWGEHRLHVQLEEAAPGERHTLVIRPSDVILGVGEPGRVSARNRLRLTVRSMVPAGERVWVRLEAPDPFLALITAEAARDLALAPGREVTALVKSLAPGTAGR